MLVVLSIRTREVKGEEVRSDDDENEGTDGLDSNVFLCADNVDTETGMEGVMTGAAADAANGVKGACSGGMP